MRRVGHFLVVVWDGGGNVVPAAGLTAALVDQGHDVRVIGTAELQTRFERVGARFRPFKRAQTPHSIEADVSEDSLLGFTRFVSGRRLADDVLEELRSEPTDVAVVDAFLSAGLAAAEKASVPAVPLVHVLYAPCVEGPVATWWDPTRSMVEMTRKRLEISAIDPAAPVMAGLWSRCPIVLACVPESFDVPCDRLPSNARYVGPIFDEPKASPWQPGAGRVLVSFSTTAMRHQHDVLQRTLDALADVDVEVVCTLGRVAIDGLSPPPNASISDWVPHRELLPRTDVVVTHAGLSHGDGCAGVGRPHAVYAAGAGPAPQRREGRGTRARHRAVTHCLRRGHSGRCGGRPGGREIQAAGEGNGAGHRKVRQRKAGSARARILTLTVAAVATVGSLDAEGCLPFRRAAERSGGGGTGGGLELIPQRLEGVGMCGRMSLWWGNSHPKIRGEGATGGFTISYECVIVAPLASGRRVACGLVVEGVAPGVGGDPARPGGRSVPARCGRPPRRSGQPATALPPCSGRWRS